MFDSQPGIPFQRRDRASQIASSAFPGQFRQKMAARLAP
jgi:hypothetical protein